MVNAIFCSSRFTACMVYFITGICYIEQIKNNRIEKLFRIFYILYLFYTYINKTPLSISLSNRPTAKLFQAIPETTIPSPYALKSTYALKISAKNYKTWWIGFNVSSNYWSISLLLDNTCTYVFFLIFFSLFFSLSSY